MCAVFWYQDWQYALPTPRPLDLEQPAVGERIALSRVGLRSTRGELLFLHFFNPDCPCSRFNIDHVRELVRRYGRRVRFVAVLQGEGGAERLLASFRTRGLEMDAIADETGSAGRVTGVYATPQAVILDREGRLYYRGNYNASRYCASPATDYARIALDAVLAGRRAPALEAAAVTAYGCPLPKRKKTAARGQHPDPRSL